MKQRYDRIGFARAAIDNLVPYVRERGTLHRKPNMPEYIELDANGLRISYAPSVRNHYIMARPRQLLDIYPIGGRKVFSVEWEPMVIIAFRGGPWVEWARAIWAFRALQ